MSTQLRKMQDLWRDSYLASGNEAYLEDLYDTYLNSPGALSLEWRSFFDKLVNQIPRIHGDISHTEIREQFLKLAKEAGKTILVQDADLRHDRQQEKIIELISAYRRLGHLQAHIDPLNLYKGVYSPALELAYYGLTSEDLN